MDDGVKKFYKNKRVNVPKTKIDDEEELAPKSKSFPILGMVLLLFAVGLTAVIFYLVMEKAGGSTNTPTEQSLESISIMPNSTGVAYISAGVGNSARLMFAPDSDKKARIVSEFELYDYPTPHVYKGLLYYVAAGNLKNHNLMTGRSADVLDVKADAINVVNEIYFYEDRLFYLFGKYCQEHKAKCDLKLYEFDFDTASSTLLAPNVEYRSFLGYAAPENALYMMYSEAEKSCFGARTGTYNFNSKKLMVAKDYNGCISSTSTEPTKMEKEFDDFLTRFTAGITVYNYMRIQSGQIVVPDKTVETPRDWMSIRFVN